MTFSCKFSSLVQGASVLLIILVSVSCDQKSERQPFKKPVLEKQAQDFAYQLELVAAVDTDFLRGITSDDNNNFYKITESGLDPNRSYFFSTMSAKDRIWSKPEEIKIDGILKNFFVSRDGKSKYIASQKRLYFSFDGKPFKLLPVGNSTSPVIDWIQYDYDKNRLFVQVGDTAVYHSQLYVVTANVATPLNSEIELWNPSLYHGDTLYYVISTGTGTEEIVKVDMKGKVHERVKAPARYRFLFLVEKNNYYFYTYDTFGGQARNILHQSFDYGKTFHRVNSFSGSRPEYGAAEAIWVRSDSYMNAISHDYGVTEYYFSDSIFHTFNDAPDSYFIGDFGKVFLVKNNHDDRSEVYRFTRRPAGSFSSPISYSIDENLHNIKLTIQVAKSKAIASRINILLYGGSSYRYRDIKDVLAQFEPSQDSTLWTASLNPDSFNIKPDDRYNLEICFSDHTKEIHYAIKDRIFSPTNIFKEHPIEVLGFITVVTILVVLICLTFFFPYGMYLLSTKVSIFRTLAKIPKIGVIFEVLDSLTMIPWLAQHPNVLDAWIIKNKDKLLHGYWNEPVFLSHADLNMSNHNQVGGLKYLPLPVSIGDKQSKPVEMMPETVGKHFRPGRMCIQILGMGGIGKTTLALKIVDWSSDGINTGYFQKHLWIPLVVDEETTDVFAIVKRKIAAFTDSLPYDDFVKSLLARQRILIFVDALSEKTKGMQDHIDKIYSNCPANALLITTRQKFDIEGVDEDFFFPRAIDGGLIHSYIEVYLGDAIKLLESDVNRSKLVTEILGRFHLVRNDESTINVPIIPILLNLILDKVKDYGNNKDVSLEMIFSSIPNAIPDILTDYITRVNPKLGENTFSDQVVLTASEVMAEECLGENLIPQKVPQPVLEKALANEGLTNHTQIVNRLISNGILTSQKIGTDFFIGFALDPVAEYLAAIRKCKRCGSNLDSWKKLYEDISDQEVKNFLKIVEIVHVSYADLYNWVKLSKVRA